MQFALDLLDVTIGLLKIDQPTQASLRRSISTSYYAVFHLLIDAASEMFVAGPERETLRAAVRRAFAHNRMADACHAFQQERHKLSKVLSAPRSSELTRICRGFLHLQEARHRADYDTSIQYSREDAELLNTTAIEVFEDWVKIRHTEDARVFLVALLLWKDLRD